MRRIILIAPLMLMALGLYACSTIEDDAPDNTTLTSDYRLPNGTLLPAGTVLSDAVDATGKQFIRFRLPESHKLVSAGRGPADTEVLLAEEGGITCTCNVGSGCNPFKATGPGGTVIGCTMSSRCTECTQRTSALTQQGSQEIIATERDADVLNIAAGVSFVTSPDELDSLSCPKSVVFKWDGFTRAVTTFVEAFQINNVEAVRQATTREQVPSNYTMLFINAYGKVMKVPVERGLTTAEQVSLAMFAARDGRDGSAQPLAEPGGRATCRCLSGSSGCIYHDRGVFPIGYAEWCEAGTCQTCQMNF